MVAVSAGPYRNYHGKISTKNEPWYIFGTISKKRLENRSPRRFEPQNLWICFSRGSGPPLRFSRVPAISQEPLKISNEWNTSINQDNLRVFEVSSRIVRRLERFKGGPEPLENEFNKILGSKREDQFSDHFSDLVQDVCSVRFSYLLRLSIIYL